jgi:hypothetical protein
MTCRWEKRPLNIATEREALKRDDAAQWLDDPARWLAKYEGKKRALKRKAARKHERDNATCRPARARAA